MHPARTLPLHPVPAFLCCGNLFHKSPARTSAVLRPRQPARAGRRTANGDTAEVDSGADAAGCRAGPAPDGRDGGAAAAVAVSRDPFEVLSCRLPVNPALGGRRAASLKARSHGAGGQCAAQAPRHPRAGRGRAAAPEGTPLPCFARARLLRSRPARPTATGCGRTLRTCGPARACRSACGATWRRAGMRSRRRFSGRPSRCCSPAGRCLLRRQQARGPLAAAPLRAAAHLAARPCLPEAFAPRVPSRTGGARTAHACCAAVRCRKQQHLWALHEPRLTSAHARSLPRAQAALLARLRARRRSASRPARARPCWQRRLACAHISSTPAASQEGARAPRRVRQNPGVPAAAGGARAARGAARRAGRQGPGREPHARAGRADGARARASGRRPGPALQPGDCCVRGHRLQPGARRARCVWAIKRAVVTRLPALLAVSAGAMPVDAMFSWPSTSAIARPGDRAAACSPVGRLQRCACRPRLGHGRYGCLHCTWTHA